MRERIKSIVLLILIITSLFFTTFLLFGKPYLETATPPAYEQLTFGELRPLEEQILPTLRLGEEDQWLRLQPWHEGYDETWEWLLVLLQLAEEAQPHDPPAATSGQQVRMAFSVPADLSWWLPSARIADMRIEEASWFAEEPQVLWYRQASGEWLRASLRTLPSNWSARLGELFALGEEMHLATPAELGELAAADEGVLLSQTVPALAVHTTVEESLETEKLLRSIFVNMALVRRIEERDGAMIYTDGQRGLRLFVHGELEYTAPENEPGVKQLALTDALRLSAQYLQLMGGWPDDLMVEVVNATKQSVNNVAQWHTYEILFRSVQKGLPLVGATPALQLYLSDRGVIYYNRQIRRLGNATAPVAPLVAPRVAIAAVASILGSQAAEGKLAMVEPVYYLENDARGQSLARPAWRIQLQNQEVAIVDGHSGEFITWLE
ncbi:MAG: hypothetical protein NUK65_00415 [Firmicutes bacterium]|nr:hypothetical protein [Bacillota bacterium]